MGGVKLNKKIIGFVVIGLFIGAGIIPNITGVITDDQLDQQQTNCDNAYAVDSGQFIAQSFKPFFNNLSRVDLFVEWWSASPPGDFIVSIRKNIDGSDLTIAQRPYTDIPRELTWIEFDFDDIPVTIGDTYYIVCRELNQPVAYEWGSIDQNMYQKGEAWWVDNTYLGDWNHIPNSDMCFKTYGYGLNPVEIFIDSIIGGFHVSADITNIGTASAQYVNWSIVLDGGFILLGGFSAGIIYELGVGKSKTIRSVSLFGIGSTTITVTVGDNIKQASGFILGPLVLNVREI
jgi:hypothetical protein